MCEKNQFIKSVVTFQSFSWDTFEEEIKNQKHIHTDEAKTSLDVNI